MFYRRASRGIDFINLGEIIMNIEVGQVWMTQDGEVVVEEIENPPDDGVHYGCRKKNGELIWHSKKTLLRRIK